MSKTIFITSFHALISRNILSSGVLQMLTKQGFSIVILVPKSKESFFTNAFQGKGIIVRGVDHSFGIREKFLRYLSFATINTTTLRIKRKTEMKGSGSITSYFLGNTYGRALARFIEKRSYSHEIFSKLFDEFKPELVVATDIQSELDVALLHEAGNRNIYRIGMVRSWDNLTSKGLIRVIPEKLLVWNEIVKREAMTHHDVPASKIVIVGIPHYDDYINKAQESKEDFYKKIGADISKKLVLVIPIGDRYLSNNTVDRDIVGILTQSLPENFQILVRLPPGDYVRTLENNKSQFGRIKVLFDRTRQPFDSIKMTEMLKEDDERLAATLKWSDVVVSGPSTVAIDAVFMDKPTVLFGFDGYEQRNYLDSIRRYYDYDNFVPVIESRGVVFAQDASELKKSVAEYISNPAKDSEYRKNLARKEAAFTDGKCTERLAKIIAESVVK